MIIFIMPLVMLLLLGYAITLEMRHIPTIVNDQSNTPQSRLLIDRISSSQFFKVQQRNIVEKEVDLIFQQKKARCILVIPKDFMYKLYHDKLVDVQVLIDASDPNAANQINNYLAQIIYTYNKDINRSLPVPFVPEPRFLYNPDLRSASFFIPGLLAIIIMLVCALLTSIAIAREKEFGTLEQILVSPVTPIQIVIGKVVPYILIGFLSACLTLFVGIDLFKVPFMGSLPELLAIMLLYIFTALSFGLMASTITKTQRDAMLFAMMVTMLPTLMLSGFIFPVDSMPLIFQWISQVVPARHFIFLIRGIMLKGTSIFEMLPQVMYLTALALLLITTSIKRFKNTLE